MHEPESEHVESNVSDTPNWLIFVDKAPDDGPWLRMSLLNPLNGAMCTLVDTPAQAEATLETRKSRS